MDDCYVVGKSYEGGDFTVEHLPKGEYEDCEFISCDFSNLDLSSYSLVNCSFRSCNLSFIKLTNTALRNVLFEECKIMAVRFEECRTFGLSLGFDHCILNHSSFFQMDLKKTVFRYSQLLEIDFTETDLTSAVFDQCNMGLSVFDRTNLEKADLSTASNFSIDPSTNRLKKAKFSSDNIKGLLNALDIIID